jgi:ATP dependent DNA ligase domain
VDQIHCHGIDIETAADVIRPRADEALNRGGEQTAGFELFFQRLALGFGSFEQGVCLADRVGETNGLASSDLLRSWHHDHAAVLCLFDLIELDGFDLRQQPLEQRKDSLADVLRHSGDGIAFNKHFVGDGAVIFKHACGLGCEGIVSKRLGSAYRAGRVHHLAVSRWGGAGQPRLVVYDST